MKRHFKLSGGDVTPCPKCQNINEFTIQSEQCAEDCCEVWMTCKCGFDPTERDTSYRYEDVWGSTDDGMIPVVMSCWNDAIQCLYGN